MQFRISPTGPYDRPQPHVYYDAGGVRPATDTEIAMHARIAELETHMSCMWGLLVDADERLMELGDTSTHPVRSKIAAMADE